MADARHDILIIGGGTAGITVAASLRRHAKRKLDIAIVEPAEHHYYQPAWTLVGAGAYSLAKTRRTVAESVPAGVALIEDAAASFQPAANAVTLASGTSVEYGQLVVCPGVVLDWQKSFEGLPSALGADGVCSNYSRDHAEYTWRCVQALQKGAKALFTQPPMPFKCPGAPQKIAYLTADHLRRKGMLKDCELRFVHRNTCDFRRAVLRPRAGQGGGALRHRGRAVAQPGGGRRAQDARRRSRSSPATARARR